MKLDSILRIAALSLASSGAFLAGCSADTSPEQTKEESVEQKSDALVNLGFSCSGLGCTCTGDVDCNNMFDGPACGSWPAKCYERGPSQYCICAPWVKNTGVARTTTGGGGTATFSTSP